jgi:hypothetical protein
VAVSLRKPLSPHSTQAGGGCAAIDPGHQLLFVLVGPLGVFHKHLYNHTHVRRLRLKTTPYLESFLEAGRVF